MTDAYNATEERIEVSFKLTWIADVLRGAGLKVDEQDGWQDRGRGEMGDVVGVLCHHTAGPATGNMPSLNTIINGRPDLSGPLAQLGLGRDGTYYIVAAGRANHAGAGSWEGITTGNSSFIGIEAENMGDPIKDPWPDVQMKAYRQEVAAILKHLGRGAEFCAGHKEYALPKGRKTDPDFDMDAFREAVRALLEPDDRPTLQQGMKGDWVKVVQSKLGIDVDGDFGPATEAAVKEFQTQNGIEPDGVVGPETWAALDNIP
ncbi:MAG TPA: N-acetylmuramoyl-L-alanine amidase [Fimbriimonas sp.]|nr:N-acetylmuramoyl-L-alanine amidase [Fimbriimonas sp.]